MRKTLVLVLSMFIMASLYGTASAWTLRVRHDPQETQARGDIRKVSSDLTAQRMFLEVSTWRRMGKHFYFIFYLDTNGSKAYDRFIELGASSLPTWKCVVEDYRTGALIGHLRVKRPNPRSVGCVIPRSWFSRIHRAVRFHVVNAAGPPYDHAPNHGEYRWV
jgi:hypothetical protein